MARIAIDMDEVIADFNAKNLDTYNKLFNDTLTPSDLQGCKLRELRPEHLAEMRQYLFEPSFFRDLAVIEHSQEVIRELAEEHEIFITTAAMEIPPSFEAKFAWLQEHFSFIPENNYVFCGNKGIIKADFLIDDNVRHFKRFAGVGLLYTSSHNIYETGYTRVNNWLEVREYFKESKNIFSI